MNEQPKKSGCGCCGVGCLTIFIIGAVLAIGLGFGTWHFYSKAIDTYTSPRAITVAATPTTSAQYSVASSKLDQLATAIAQNQETTIEFTDADLNALIARHPNFSSLRGRFAFSIANSIMQLEMSVPLAQLPLPKLRDRWFNGIIRFGFDYDGNRFTFDPKSADAAGHPLPDILLSPSFTNAFNDSFGKGFRESVEKNPQGAQFWNHVKSMTVRDNKLVVTTSAGSTL